jgi:hypothetical protein
MKVAITGHTSGFGNALFDILDNKVGFSRSNGYNIEYSSDRRRILEEIDDCDVFINNAYSGFHQVDMLYDVWDKWKTLDKKIVCVSSIASEHVYNKFPHNKYITHKSALDAAAAKLSFIGGPCKVMNLKPGNIDTPMISTFPDPKMCPAELARFIVGLIQLDASFWIPSITIYPK